MKRLIFEEENIREDWHDRFFRVRQFWETSNREQKFTRWLDENLSGKWKYIVEPDIPLINGIQFELEEDYLLFLLRWAQ